MTAHIVESLVVQARSGYLFDPKQSGIGLIKLDISTITGFGNNFVAGYSDPVTDTFYFVHTNNKLATWNTSPSYLTYTWKSKMFELPYPSDLLAGQIKGDTLFPDTTINIYADKTLAYTRTGNNYTEFVVGRPTVRAKDYEIEVIGTATIRVLELSETMDELL